MDGSVATLIAAGIGVVAVVATTMLENNAVYKRQEKEREENLEHANQVKLALADRSTENDFGTILCWARYVRDFSRALRDVVDSEFLDGQQAYNATSVRRMDYAASTLRRAAEHSRERDVAHRYIATYPKIHDSQLPLRMTAAHLGGAVNLLLVDWSSRRSTLFSEFQQEVVAIRQQAARVEQEYESLKAELYSAADTAGIRPGDARDETYERWLNNIRTNGWINDASIG